MKLVYIAGPYRGPNTWAIEQNIRRAEDAAALVWSAGLAALCPHANARHMDGVTSVENFLDGTLEMLRRCDAVLLVEGWQDSEGACAEVREAMWLGKPVMYQWHNTTYTLYILRELSAEHRIDDVSTQDPFKGAYWCGRST